MIAGVLSSALVLIGLPLLVAPAAQAVGFTLSGTVTAAESPNTPLAGIDITVTDADTGQAVDGSTTNGTGSYSFSGLPSVVVVDYVDPTDTRVSLRSEYVELSADLVKDVSLSIAGSITATVRDDAGSPIAATVDVSRPSDLGGDYVTSADVAGDGLLQVRGLAPGDYILHFSRGSTCLGGCPEIVDEWWKDADSPFSAALVTVVAGGSTVLAPDPRVTRFGTLTGTLQASSAPASADVSVYPVGTADTGASGLVYQVQDDGSFSIPLAPGSYKLRISEAGFADWWFGGGEDVATATAFTVASANTKSLGTLIDPFTGSIGGVLQDATGPIDGGVVLYDSRGNYRGQTGGSGAYVLHGVPPGQYTVDAYSFGYGDLSTTVTVGSSLVSHTFTFVPSPSGTAAGVTVAAVLSGGAPLTGGGSVNVFDATTQDYAGYCDLDVLTGTCQVSGLAPGSYRLAVQAATGDYVESYYGGQASIETSTPVALVDGDNGTRTVTMQAAGSVSIVVRNESGTAQGGYAQVTAAGSYFGEQVIGAVETGQSSAPTTVGQLRAGSYTVAVQSDVGEVVSAHVTVTAGATTPVQLTLRAATVAAAALDEPATADVVGAVVDSSNVPIAGADVCALDTWTLAYVCDVTTNGAYRLVGLHADPSLSISVDKQPSSYLHGEGTVAHTATGGIATNVPAITLNTPATVSGTISKAGALPAADVNVKIYKDGYEQSSMLTGTGGGYSLAGLPPGTYTLVASPVSDEYDSSSVSSEFEPTWFGGGIDPNAATTITVASGELASGKNITLQTARTPTSTTVVGSELFGKVGDVVTFTATVARFTGAGAVPTGTVTFSDPQGAGVLGHATVGPTGVATIQWTVDRPYLRTLVATYGGSVTYGSSSGALSDGFAASGYATTTSLASSSLTPIAGAHVTLTATVTSSVAVDGYVFFSSGGHQLGFVRVGAGGVARLDTTALGEGAHDVVARYSPGFGCGGFSSVVGPYGCLVAASGSFFEDSTSNVLTISVGLGAGSPQPPTSVSATAGNGSAQVSWAAPATNGGSAILDYTVTASPGGATATVAGTSATVSGLSNGTSYTFTVKARNAAGSSASSAPSGAVVPSTVPGAPTGVSAVGANGGATVTWAAPASNGGSAILDYTVTASPGGASVTVGGTSATVPGLVNGTGYTFTVTARNARGSSAASAPSNVVLAASPSLPTVKWVGVAVPTIVGKPKVSWTAQSSNPLARIEVRVRSGASGSPLGAFGAVQSLAATATTYTVASPKSGTAYCIGVTAVDLAGGRSPELVRCITVVANDIALTASTGWKSVLTKGAVGGQERRIAKVGATLVIAKATGKQLVLVVGKQPGAGTVGIYVGTKLVKKLALTATKSLVAQRVTIATGTMKGSKITIKVLTAGTKGVRIDGFAVIK